MKSERWREIERLYETALRLQPGERVQFLAAITDPSLRREVESLLDMRPAADSFFDRPVLAPRTQAAPDLDPGTCVGPYVVKDVLGTGGMGEVYKARDQRLARDVALKFLPASSCNDSLALQRMQREARAASALNHPRICTLYDIGEHGGRPFLVMELLDGATLKERLISGPLPITDVVSIGLQITDALMAAHAKGIIHCDIKPTNISVNEKGEIKLLDFGLAKLVAETARESAATAAGSVQVPREMAESIAGAAYGTAPYMSPEQIRGEPVDARSDLFSVGVTLYEMATGRLPFPGDTAEQTMRAIIADAPLPARAVNSAVPPALEAILLKALEKDKTKRYQSAADLNRDLTKLRSSRSRARHWKLAAGSALAFAVAVGAAIKSGAFTVVPRAPDLALRQVTANPIEDPVFRGSISPDGRYAAYSDLDGLHIRRIDTGETRSITPPAGLCFR